MKKLFNVKTITILTTIFIAIISIVLITGNGKSTTKLNSFEIKVVSDTQNNTCNIKSIKVRQSDNKIIALDKLQQISYHNPLCQKIEKLNKFTKVESLNKDSIIGAADIDFDGNNDLLIQSTNLNPQFKSYLYYQYEPKTNSFKRNYDLDKLILSNTTFNKKDKTIISTRKYDAAKYLIKKYTWEKGKPKLIYIRQRTYLNGELLTSETKQNKKGQMVTTVIKKEKIQE